MILLLIKFNKNQLDLLATIFGAIAGICTVFATQKVGDIKVVGTIGGVSTVLLGVVSQRPADAHPTTEDVEDSK